MIAKATNRFAPFSAARMSRRYSARVHERCRQLPHCGADRHPCHRLRRGRRRHTTTPMRSATISKSAASSRHPGEIEPHRADRMRSRGLQASQSYRALRQRPQTISTHRNALRETKRAFLSMLCIGSARLWIKTVNTTYVESHSYELAVSDVALLVVLTLQLFWPLQHVLHVTGLGGRDGANCERTTPFAGLKSTRIARASASYQPTNLSAVAQLSARRKQSGFHGTLTSAIRSQALVREAEWGSLSSGNFLGTLGTPTRRPRRATLIWTTTLAPSFQRYRQSDRGRDGWKRCC